MLACLLGISHHDLADLVGNLRSAATNQLVMDPSDDDNIAVPAVAKARAKLVMNVDEPSLANHRFGRVHRLVERLVLSEPRTAPASSPGCPPALPWRREFRPKLAEPGC